MQDMGIKTLKDLQAKARSGERAYLVVGLPPVLMCPLNSPFRVAKQFCAGRRQCSRVGVIREEAVLVEHRGLVDTLCFSSDVTALRQQYSWTLTIGHS